STPLITFSRRLRLRTLAYFHPTTLIFFLLPYLSILMIPRPPTSTLFPTRRSSDLGGSAVLFAYADAPLDLQAFIIAGVAGVGARSEEHTSELQSRVDLVCRLLLEKKKIKWTQSRAVYSVAMKFSALSGSRMHNSAL